jgi:hypothetical protein
VPSVLLKLADLGEKKAPLAGGPATFLIIAHYDGYPTALVRLAAVDGNELRELVVAAWYVMAPRVPPRRTGLPADPLARRPSVWMSWWSTPIPHQRTGR